VEALSVFLKLGGGVDLSVGGPLADRLLSRAEVNNQTSKVQDDVRYWHLADIALCAAHVCFQGQSGHRFLRRTCLLLTQSGHSVSRYFVVPAPAWNNEGDAIMLSNPLSPKLRTVEELGRESR
jgi:hypothetical protein